MTKRYAIIGNGPLGEDVTSDADCVVRFNHCRSAGEDEARTDIVAVCNTGRPAVSMLEDDAWLSHPSVGAAQEIWCVRAPERYERMREEIALTHPELDDYCDDYTEGFREFAARSSKQFRVISSALHEQVEAELDAFGAGKFVSPSSGLLVVAEILENHASIEDSVTIAGFSHQGWEHHPWDAEKRWVDGQISQGRLRRSQELQINKSYQEFDAHAS